MTMDLPHPDYKAATSGNVSRERVLQGVKEPIAVVGIGCRFPGGASNPKAFWNMLRRKKDAIVDVPGDRWDVRRFYHENPDKPGKMYVKQGGFLKEKIDRFDPLFFGISPREGSEADFVSYLMLRDYRRELCD